MQASQWTTEIIVICGVLAIAAAVIGYVLAALRQGRQIGQLSMQLEQAEQARASTETQQQSLQIQLKAVEARSHPSTWLAPRYGCRSATRQAGLC